jgi:hypothetical protein
MFARLQHMQETFNEKTIPKYQTTQCRFDFQSLLFQFPLKEGINSKVLTYNQIGFLSNAANLIILYPQNGPKIIQNQTWFNLGCGKFKASSRGSPLRLQQLLPATCVRSFRHIFGGTGRLGTFAAPLEKRKGILVEEQANKYTYIYIKIDDQQLMLS